MLITIENFGAIKHFEFDTDKDMYLIFGKNSVGKSYGISLVYLILKFFNARSDSAFGMKFYELEAHNFLGRQANTLDSVILDADAIKKNLVHFLNSYFIPELSHSLINSFSQISDLQNQLTEQPLKITLDCSHFGSSFIIGLKKEATTFEIVDCYFKQHLIDSLLVNSDFIDTVGRLFKEFLISGIYFLPASRSGLYQGLGSFAQIAAELSKSRNLISKPIQLPAISVPLADYFLRLSETNSENQSGLSPYTDEIENEIMSGKVEFDDETKRLIFKPNGTELKLDLSSTSSMVSEIAPIVAYLKHTLPNADSSKPAQKPLIFIEEPEAHLHPETQVKLMNVFARLVKDDKIKLVMTSHSNYIFNKASNLVMDGKIDPDKFKAVLFRMTETGSIAENMATDAYGIDDDNFIDTAESLYEEKLAIINKLNG
jgi:hypothetical protein